VASGGEQAEEGGSSSRASDGGRGLGREDRAGEGSSGERSEAPGGEAGVVPGPPGSPVAVRQYTPLYHAQHADRYERQALIREYEEKFGCRLIVFIDAIFPEAITLLEELIVDATPTQDLHLLLDTPGGDGETAVRMVRAMQARCQELTVLVPNQAKSAGTILVLGAHHIYMGPASDLGPVDPQFQHPKGQTLYSGKDLIKAVENAEKAIAANASVYPLHASLLADFSAVMVEEARSAIDRTSDLVREALASNADRQETDVSTVAEALNERLIEKPQYHGAVFGADDAEALGLPVIRADLESDQWKMLWRLWAKYFHLDAYVAEGRYASQVTKRGAYA
jgi:hypothetical protein